MALFLRSCVGISAITLLFLLAACGSGCPSGQKSENGVCVPEFKHVPPSQNENAIDGDINTGSNGGGSHGNNNQSDGDEDTETDNSLNNDGDETGNNEDGDYSEPDGDEGASESTWRDSVSGLTWQRKAKSGLLFEDAEPYCGNLTLDGAGGWRLPTISELRTLIVGCADTETGGACEISDGCSGLNCSSQECKNCSYEGGPSESGCYLPEEMSDNCTTIWSSTRMQDNEYYIWAVYFQYGWIEKRLTTKTNGVLCVK